MCFYLKNHPFSVFLYLSMISTFEYKCRSKTVGKSCFIRFFFFFFFFLYSLWKNYTICWSDLFAKWDKLPFICNCKKRSVDGWPAMNVYRQVCCSTLTSEEPSQCTIGWVEFPLPISQLFFRCAFYSAKFKLLLFVFLCFIFFPPQYTLKDTTETINHFGQQTSRTLCPDLY